MVAPEARAFTFQGLELGFFRGHIPGGCQKTAFRGRLASTLPAGQNSTLCRPSPSTDCALVCRGGPGCRHRSRGPVSTDCPVICRRSPGCRRVGRPPSTDQGAICRRRGAAKWPAGSVEARGPRKAVPWNPLECGPENNLGRTLGAFKENPHPGGVFFGPGIS